MMSTGTATRSFTFTKVDVENVVRRVKADLAMIADSTGAWTPDMAANYAHDIELLAKNGYLAWVDVTLFSYGSEVKAVRFEVDTDSGSLVSSRPGDVLWPKVPEARLRIVISYTGAYNSDAKREMSEKLRVAWTTTFDDTSHSSLNSAAGRNYTSNSFGMKRKDWTN